MPLRFPQISLHLWPVSEIVSWLHRREGSTLAGFIWLWFIVGSADQDLRDLRGQNNFWHPGLSEGKKQAWKRQESKGRNGAGDDRQLGKDECFGGAVADFVQYGNCLGPGTPTAFICTCYSDVVDRLCNLPWVCRKIEAKFLLTCWLQQLWTSLLNLLASVSSPMKYIVINKNTSAMSSWDYCGGPVK